ncbi:protein DpdH [Streptomyces sp. S.PB5]|uniref:protein DpdH n=1 Tax=Streptomyces sp. S.PB5 TaxID=3020844 RepID=UPI0025B24C17|nr:protein DpdH [Streptomyces sp. S.PB5]MDN3029459.1 protein DpdH [Streptomyces sp. S.PB5]
MADFRRMLCWEPAVAASTINTEAVSPSRAVFLATHAPLRIKRARIMDGRELVIGGDPIGERAVLEDFLALRADSGTLLMPVVGESGSGKSHLVRWVREQLADVEGSDKREVIYLEKSKTSLKAVVSTLIAQVQSKELAQLKEDIDRFTEDIDEESLARRILNELSEALEATSPSSESLPLARMLVGPGKLAAVLLDPHVRAELLAPGKFVPELAHQLIHNRRDGQADRPEGFSVSDLPLDIRDIQSASGMAQRLLGTISTRGDLQGIAVDLLNRHLEAAIKSAANLGAGRLLDAMKQVREEYHRQGKEIVLLIEDFALIQGVQRDLLDAVVEAANREGETTLAPIRTLMAVTTGYFQSLEETVLTRIQAATGYVYHLDVPFSPEETGRTEIASFVGRYLNAARSGRDELERARDEVPNKCAACPLRTECHAAFGATADGYGLYPFNESSLVRAVHSTADQTKPWSFNPRAVLGSVVRPVLVEHATAMRQGEFPDPMFRQRFRPTKLDRPVSRDVLGFVAANDHDPASAERRNLVLEFWGDAPEHANSLHPTILEAFSLEPLGNEGGQSRSPASVAVPGQSNPGGAKSEAGASGKHSEFPRELQRMLETVDEWLTREGGLDTATATRIRGIVSTAVVQRYQWNSPLMRAVGSTELRKAAWPSKATVVSIEGAKENLVGVENAPITFSRRPKDSWFFDSLLKADRDLPARAEDIRRLAFLAEEHGRDLTARLQQHMEVTDDHLVAGFRASLIGAALAGRAWPGMPTSQLVAAALDDGQEWRREDSGTRSEKWMDLLRAHLRARPDLVKQLRHAVGIAQGMGAVNMIDAARVLPLLDKAASSWNWDAETLEIPKWVKPSITGFASWTTTLEDQLSRHEELLNSIRSCQPRGTTGVQAMAAIRDALGAAREVGLPLTAVQTRQFDALLQGAQNADWKTISALEDDLAKASDASRDASDRHDAQLVAAIKDRGDSLKLIQQLLIVSNDWLDAALASAESRSSGSAGDSAAEDVGQICVEWQALTAVPSAEDDGEDW